MPSSSRGRGRGRPRAHSPTITESDNIDTSVSDTKWDCNTATLPVFLPDLHKELPEADPRFLTLVKKRQITTGRYTCCVSLNHIDRLMTKSFLEGTWR